MIRAIHIFLLCLALAACATSRAPDPEDVFLAPGVAVRLPAIVEPGRRFDAAQMIVANFREANVAFEMRLGLAPGTLSAVAVDTLGRRALTIDWTQAGMKATVAPWLADRMSVRNMLVDMVLIYWPEDAVRRMLEGTGTTLTATSAERRIEARGQDLVRIDYTPSVERAASGTVTYSNLVWGYTITIRSVEVGG